MPLHPEPPPPAMHKFSHFVLTVLLSSLALRAAPLSAPTAVHLKPDAKAPVLVVLSPGTEPEPATTAIATTPAGWMAVQLPGPFDGYVLNSDIDKALNVKPGVGIHLQPGAESGVLAIMELGDKTTITGLHGKWSQIRLEKPVTGYIRVADSPKASPAPIAAAVAAPPPARSTGAATYQTAPLSPAPAYLSDKSSGVLPRLFQGKFVSTRRPFTPRRPHDWQLNDAAGVRYAYLDISRLMLTDQIENYADRDVVVYGTAKTASDGHNLVILVETLRLQ